MNIAMYAVLQLTCAYTGVIRLLCVETRPKTRNKSPSEPIPSNPFHPWSPRGTKEIMYPERGISARPEAPDVSKGTLLN